MADVAASVDPASGVHDRADLSDTSSNKDLIQQLDELLERYLHTLDEYQKLRNELSDILASGYMSLAQANFHNSSTTIRYGKDCYDDRMQAIRKVYLSEVLDDGFQNEGMQFAIGLQKELEAGESEKGEEKQEEKEASKSPEKEKQDASDGSVKQMDPLRWFGILVPSALRTAQSTFITAIQGPVAGVVTLATDLRRQEMEIGRMKKKIKKLQCTIPA